MQGGGHGGSHPHLAHEIIDALVTDRDPFPNAKQSANWTSVGLCAHESAMAGARAFHERAEPRVDEAFAHGLRGVVGGGEFADGSEGAFQTREKFIVEMRELANRLGIDTTRDVLDEGTVRDITSEARLGMIFDIQTARAAEFAKWKMEQDADVLDAFPAQELCTSRRAR